MAEFLMLTSHSSCSTAAIAKTPEGLIQLKTGSPQDA